MIRLPKITEFHQLGKIYIECMKKIEHPDVDASTEELFLIYLYKFAQTPKCTMRVSLDDKDESKVTGFITGSIQLCGSSSIKKGFCDNLFVLDEYSHQHNGPKLINELVKWFKEYDVDVYEFMCLNTEKNIKRWEALGYKKKEITFSKKKSIIKEK